MKISVPKEITVGLLILTIWKKLDCIPGKLTAVNLYLNYSGQPQHLLREELFEMSSLFDLNPKEILSSLPPNFRIEISKIEGNRNQIKLNQIIPYLRAEGIEWI